MKFVFAKTRHQYDSYRDFWKLVELSGYVTCYVDQIDLSLPLIYITTPINGEHRPHIINERMRAQQVAKIIWWNLERPDTDGSEPIGRTLDDILKYVDAVWVSDRFYASMNHRMKFVVLGGDSRLRLSQGRLPQEYDYTHQSYAWGRRDAIYYPLREELREGPNAWFEEKDRVLRSSRLMLNVHQTPALIGEPLRFVVTSAYAMPMVSETLADQHPMVAGHDHIQAPFDELVEMVKKSLHRSDLDEMGNNLRKRFCEEWTFRRGVEEGIAETVALKGW